VLDSVLLHLISALSTRKHNDEIQGKRTYLGLEQVGSRLEHRLLLMYSGKSLLSSQGPWFSYTLAGESRASTLMPSQLAEAAAPGQRESCLLDRSGKRAWISHTINQSHLNPV